MMHFPDLDSDVRRMMLLEFDLDAATAALFLSPWLSERGRADYPALLREAILHRDEEWLAGQLRQEGRLVETEEYQRGETTHTRRLRHDAAEVLADDEFNRFYMRGLCRLALERGIPDLVIRRVKEAEHPRPESQERLGQRIGAQFLLEDLRRNVGVDTALGIPPGPGSGLSVGLP